MVTGTTVHRPKAGGGPLTADAEPIGTESPATMLLSTPPRRGGGTIKGNPGGNLAYGASIMTRPGKLIPILGLVAVVFFVAVYRCDPDPSRKPRPDPDLSAPSIKHRLFPRLSLLPDRHPPTIHTLRCPPHRETAMLELPSTRSADIRAGHAETGGGDHLDTGGGSPGDKWQLRELEQTQESIAKETAKLAQEVQRLSKSVQESAKRVDAIPELLDTAPADGTGDSKGSVDAPVDSNVQAKAPIGTGESFFLFSYGQLD